MRISVSGGKNYIEVETHRFFNTNKQYKWFDWKKTKKDANEVVKRLRKDGHLARIVPNTKGYSIYTHAQ